LAKRWNQLLEYLRSFREQRCEAHSLEQLIEITSHGLCQRLATSYPGGVIDATARRKAGDLWKLTARKFGFKES
jgi:hypothetical protein